MKRLLKIAGIGCLGLLTVLAALVAWNWGRIARGVEVVGVAIEGADEVGALQTPEALADYILRHRQDVSLVSYALTDGALRLELNPDVPRPVASTIKIQLLAGYARALETGELRADERVPLEHVERFWMPGTDGGAHDAALEVYRGNEWLDDAGTIALEHVVWAMIVRSDNAATDYVIHRLGRATVEGLPQTLGVPDEDPPLPLSGVFMSWADPGSEERPLADVAYEQAAALWNDEAARARSKQAIHDVGLPDQIRLTDERSPRGTAAGYADLMARIYRGRLISGDASALMRSVLDWPMDNAPIRAEFDAFGTKGGSLPGVLTGATFARPAGRAEGHVVALFFEDLPGAVWLHLSRTYLQQDLERRLLSDEAFFESLRERSTGGSSRD